MKPLLILLASFLVATVSIKLLQKEYDINLSGKIAMSIMLGFTAIGHFAFTKGMTLMLPSFIPLKEPIIYFTGVLEILLAIGLLIPKYSVWSAYIIIVFFVLLLPANIFASIYKINYQTGTLDGPGLSYLWFRIPLQLFFIWWVFRWAIKS
jgi:uncharacterized membrane protein